MATMEPKEKYKKALREAKALRRDGDDKGAAFLERLVALGRERDKKLATANDQKERDDINDRYMQQVDALQRTHRGR